MASDLASDSDVQFIYTLTINSTAVHGRTFSELVTFNEEGKATLRMKPGESITLHFPDKILDAGGAYAGYNVKVTGVSANGFGADLGDYSLSIVRNEGLFDDGESCRAVSPAGSTEAGGTLGENLKISPPSGSSYVTFTYTRNTGDLVISTTAAGVQAEEDEPPEYPFELTLKDTSNNRTYDTVNQAGETGSITFNGGALTFNLRSGESIRINGLPTDLQYTVTEKLANTAGIRTTVSKDGGTATTRRTQEGIIGEHTVDGRFVSTVHFANSSLSYVCKITNRSRALLYYAEGDKTLTPAVFDNLADAFRMVNAGSLRTAGNGSVPPASQVRIELLVPNCTLGEQCVLDSGRTVVLSTARVEDAEDQYPLTGTDGQNVASVVTRGSGFTESMILSRGKLTLDGITLDGGKMSDPPANTAAQDGGIIRVDGGVTLTVNSGAALRNSATSENGGAIWLGSGATLDLYGTIYNCSAASGGGVYAGTDYAKLELRSGSTIAGCSAAFNGGGVCAMTGTLITVYNGAALKGNHAGGNGGAICSDTNVTLRGMIGGTETGDGNSANSGGGVYMGAESSFTMYSTGSICGNAAEYGGGLFVANGAKATIAGRATTGGDASGTGTDGCILNNHARNSDATSADPPRGQGGGIYIAGTVSMTKGSMTGNTASLEGGAVFVAAGKTFTMSGGEINGANRSPGGAIAAGGATSRLYFSGNVKVQGNTDLSDSTVAKNVYLGYDSNDVIRTTGLSGSAYIGVYVANGENNALYYEHGIADRNFGTYTGSSLDSANLNAFHNDRDALLTGIAGEGNLVMWPGKDMYIQVLNLKEKNEFAPINGAKFTLTNINTKETVWSGKSQTAHRKDGVELEGLLTIPWSKIEDVGSNTAIFFRHSVYLLEQTETDFDECVMPGGKWLVYVKEGNIVEWLTVLPGQTYSWETDPNNRSKVTALSVTGTAETEVNRTLDITTKDPKDASVLGSTFRLYNDRRPKVSFDPNGSGATLSDGRTQPRVEKVQFGEDGRAMSVVYKISEGTPIWNTVFLGWNTKKDGTGTDYKNGDTFKFYRHSDNDDLVLYADWRPVVCKITDQNGKLLYTKEGTSFNPAVYSTLEAGFNAFAGTRYFYDSQGREATAHYIKMLKDSYELAAPIELKTGSSRLSTAYLTTATSNYADEDRYPFTGDGVCTVSRGENNTGSLFALSSMHLALSDITLDGGVKNTAGDSVKYDEKSVSINGALVNVGTKYRLIVSEGTTLRNAVSSGSGGAVYVNSGGIMIMTGGSLESNEVTEEGSGAGVYLSPGSTMMMTGGTIRSNRVTGTGGGAGVYLSEGATLQISGNPAFNGSNTKGEDKQDIYIAGYAGEEGATNAVSLVVTGNISSGDNAAIWVWAAEMPHYKLLQQFGKIADGVSVTPETLEVFRNARPDDDTDNTSSNPLYGEQSDGNNICWSGITGVRKVILRKVDGSSFDSLSVENLPALRFDILTTGGKPVYENLTPEGKDNGVFFVGELSVGYYFIRESGSSSGDYAIPEGQYHWYQLNVGSEGDAVIQIQADGNVYVESAERPALIK